MLKQLFILIVRLCCFLQTLNAFLKSTFGYTQSISIKRTTQMALFWKKLPGLYK